MSAEQDYLFAAEIEHWYSAMRCAELDGRNDEAEIYEGHTNEWLEAYHKYLGERAVV